MHAPLLGTHQKAGKRPPRHRAAEIASELRVPRIERLSRSRHRGVSRPVAGLGAIRVAGANVTVLSNWAVPFTSRVAVRFKQGLDLKLRASWSGEFVTDSLNSHNQLGMTGILLQLVPQARHVHIDCTCQRARVIAPNRP